MKPFQPYVIKRAAFMFGIMFPILLVLEFTGHTSNAITAALAGILGGVSVVLFPSPEHIKKLNEMKKNEQNDKK